jgi:uncharacterized hydrophobic protein (TIGR00341 family)
MPLRLLEVLVPDEDVHTVEALLEDASVVQVWAISSMPRAAVLRILVDARDTESVSDRLAERYQGREGFRMTLFQVEATVPAVKEEEADDPGDEAENAARAERISREELYEDISAASRLTSPYVVMVALSTLVAAVGLVRGDIPIVVGAMVIAPLLGPNVALSLAVTLGDLDLVRRALRVIAAGLGTAGLVSLVLGIVLAIDPTFPELARRTGAGLGDIVLALAAGVAGSLAFTTGVPSVVVGVMVALALLPPLVVAGLLAGAGFGAPALGALALVLTNVTCVNLAAVGTFLVQRVGPRSWWEEGRARRATAFAVAIWISMLLILGTLIVLGYVDVQEV